MRILKALLAGAALLVTGYAQADVTETITAISDYDFRGISLTARDPALQGGLDYVHDSGFSAGVWGSNVDFGDCCDENIEVDYYLGYDWGTEESTQWGVYATYYTYPGAESDGASLDYAEVNVGGTYQWFNAKLWYAWDYGNLAEDGYYADLNGTFELPKDFGLVTHVGYSFGSYWSDIVSDEYFDYSVGVTKSLGHFDLAMRFIDGSDLKDDGVDANSTDAKVVFSVATTFPWSSE